MRKLLISLALAAAATAASAQFYIGNKEIGSGASEFGEVLASEVHNGYFHAPQYMPGYPTAATIWPKVIKTKCQLRSRFNVGCRSYDYDGKIGRTEYLYFAIDTDQDLQKSVDTLSRQVYNLQKQQTDLKKSLDNKEPVKIYIEVLPKKIKE